MPAHSSLVKRLAVAGSFIVVAVLVFVAEFWAELDVLFGWTEPLDTLLLFAQLGVRVAVPLLLGALAARWVSRRWKTEATAPLRPAPSSRKWITVLVLASYAGTWIFGVPAAHTASMRAAVEAVEAHRSSTKAHQSTPSPGPAADGSHEVGPGAGHERRSKFPLSFDSAFPLLPLVVASHEKYSTSGSDNSAQWTIRLWYVTGVKELFRLRTWP